MPYQSRDLSVLSYANGFTLWHYKTPDNIHDVRASGYFDRASHMLRVGDMIITTTNAGPSPGMAILGVAANFDGSVRVGPFASPSNPDGDADEIS